MKNVRNLCTLLITLILCIKTYAQTPTPNLEDFFNAKIVPKLSYKDNSLFFNKKKLAEYCDSVVVESVGNYTGGGSHMEYRVYLSFKNESAAHQCKGEKIFLKIILLKGGEKNGLYLAYKISISGEANGCKITKRLILIGLEKWLEKLKE